jgi:integrase
MTVYRRGGTWWYHFTYAGKHVQKSAKTSSKTIAKEAEKRHRRQLEEGFNGLDDDPRKERIRSIAEMADEYQEDYQLRHPESANFPKYTSPPIVRLLGNKMLCDVSAEVVEEYMNTRLQEGYAPSTINGEAELLLRIIGTTRGDLVRAQLKRRAKSRSWKLRISERVGKAHNVEQKDALLAAAEEDPSKYIRVALRIAMNGGLRLKETRTIRLSQFDFTKRILTVGKSKTAAGEDRTIPLNAEIWPMLMSHLKWYGECFGELKPEWYLFPAGRGKGLDPNRPVSSWETAWRRVREKAGVEGRWHDHRHTLGTELAEQGASDVTIMSLLGWQSKKMLTHYSHIRIEAKRRALDQVLVRRDEQRLANAEKAAEEVSLPFTIN